MVEKRGLEDASGGDATKKPKLGEQPAGGSAAPAAPAPAKPGLSLEALEKAKKALQLRKELQEKLKNIPQLNKPAATPAPPSAGTPDMLAAATAKAAQIAASFGVAVQLPSTTPSVPAVPTLRPQLPSAGFKIAPLRLDKYGREVDEHGNVINRPVQVVTTLKVNQQVAAQAAAAAAATAAAAPEALNPLLQPITAPDGSADPGFDPRMAGGAGPKRADRRRKSTFDFVQEGVFQKQAEMIRLRAKYGDQAVRRAALPKGPIGPEANPNLVPLGGAAASLDPNQVPIGVRRAASEGPASEEVEAASPRSRALSAEPAEPVPDVEWWDRALLPGGSYEADVPLEGEEPPNIKQNKITLYVEHPVPIEPPAEAPPPPPQPLKLTKKEIKKLRTQRRQAREKEKQELIRQGLLEPPKPKIKISNLYRVLAEQAVADPTALEQEARRQMAERQAAHDDRNLARMLTPEERRDKKLKKLLDGDGAETLTCIYKVLRLSNPQNRFKVDINAKENHMTGVVLITDEFCLVVVEGGPKAIKRYMKLMLRRIDWTAEAEGGEEDEEGGEADMDEDKAEREPNTCDLVWQGVVASNVFKDFRVHDKGGVPQARAILEGHGVGHYWDIARNFVREDAAPITL